MAGAISVSGLVKTYGEVVALNGISFEVAPGEIFGLLGPNGAGKTTTIDCLLGLSLPDQGSVQVCGFDSVKDRRQIKVRIGAALQSTSLQDDITPREALKLFGSFYPKTPKLSETLARFSLVEKADARFASLSDGQKQRLALALAVVNEPEVLVLDEPTAGLDPQSRRDLHDTISSLRERGRTILLTTHYLEEADALCDRVAIIDQGRMVALGTPAELIANSSARPRIIFRAARPIDPSAFAKYIDEEKAAAGPNSWEIVTGNIPETVVRLVRFLQAAGNELTALDVRQPTLEDVFVDLTGRMRAAPLPRSE